MNKGLKVALLITSVAGVGVLVWLMFFKKDSQLYVLKQTEQGEEDSLEEYYENEISGGTSTGGTSTGSTSTGSTTSCPYPSTPFKNRTEGDAFREWVNDAYGSIAKVIDGGTGKSDGLSRSGDYNNCYIREAYQYKATGGRTLGNIWQSISSTGTAPTTTTTPTTTIAPESLIDKLRSKLESQNTKFKNQNGNVVGMWFKTGNTEAGANNFNYYFRFKPDGTWGMTYRQDGGDWRNDLSFGGKWGFTSAGKFWQETNTQAKNTWGNATGKRMWTATSIKAVPKEFINLYWNEKMSRTLVSSFYSYSGTITG